MDKWECKERYDSKWGNSLIHRGSPNWWKDEEESLEMVCSSLEETSNEPVRKSDLIQVEGTKKVRKTKNNISRGNKKRL